MNRPTVLLTHSYFLRFDPKQWKIGQPYAPLGTLYAAACLREQGYPVALHDVQLSDGPGGLQAPLMLHQPKYLVIWDDGFNYLTKMCLTNMREAAGTMIAMAKAQGCTVIVSSSDATDHAGEYLNAGADFILIGEGEQTLVELIDSLERGTEVTKVNGLAYRHAGGLHRTAPRVVLRDLDALPLPAWDLVDLEAYRSVWMKSSGYFSVNLSTTRGCPFRCNWCAKPIYGNRYHAHSPERVVDEILLLQSRTSVAHIWFADDIFGLKPGWVQRFAALIKEQGLALRFKIQSRADLLVQDRYVEALAEAGCEEVWMGAESGSQKVLDAMDKGITVEQIARATQTLVAHGIRPCFFLQFGYPGEEREDIEQTLKMLRALRPHAIGISVSYPLPGTPFYEQVKAELQGKSNWTDSDDLALMFHNTYSPRFYRHLHQHVHLQYRTQQASEQLQELFRRPSRLRWTGWKKALSTFYLRPATLLSRYRLHRLAQTHV